MCTSVFLGKCLNKDQSGKGITNFCLPLSLVLLMLCAPPGRLYRYSGYGSRSGPAPVVEKCCKAHPLYLYVVVAIETKRNVHGTTTICIERQQLDHHHHHHHLLQILNPHNREKEGRWNARTVWIKLETCVERLLLLLLLLVGVLKRKAKII